MSTSGIGVAALLLGEDLEIFGVDGDERDAVVATVTDDHGLLDDGQALEATLNLGRCDVLAARGRAARGGVATLKRRRRADAHDVG